MLLRITNWIPFKRNENRRYAPTVQGHSVLESGTILKEKPSTEVRVSEPTLYFIGVHFSGHNTCQGSHKVPGDLLLRANCPAS